MQARIKLIIKNLSHDPVVIDDGERGAQMNYLITLEMHITRFKNITVPVFQSSSVPGFQHSFDRSSDRLFARSSVRPFTRSSDRPFARSSVHFILSLLFLTVLQSYSLTVLAQDSSKLIADKPTTKNRDTYYEAAKQKVLGNNDKAIDLFKKCLDQDPADAAAMYELANIYSDEGKLN